MLNLLWLQSGGCGGCTMSLLSANNPHLMQQLSANNINLLWHPSISEESSTQAIQILKDILDDKIKLDILCLEGSLLRAPNKTGFCHMMAGTDIPFIDWMTKLSAKSDYTIAVGTCAAYGGITAAGGNPTDACGLQYEGHLAGGLLSENYTSKKNFPVINISGCPTHPDWVLITLSMIANNQLVAEDLDEYKRPKFFTQHLVHHGCNRNEFYEFKASADQPTDLGCMMENMGCLGTQAQADCNIRPWPGGGSCTSGGYACINCTAPDFEEPNESFMKTPKLAGIPVGLPLDVPKAWFIALSTLSKSATPERLRETATSDTITNSEKNAKQRGKNG